MVIEICLIIFIFSYHVFVFMGFLAWKSIAVSRFDTNAHDFESKLSLVIAFKNEVKNLPMLLNCLENQKLEKNRFEVIFVNDHSSDHSLTFLLEYQQRSKLAISILTNCDVNQGKKQALQLGIEKSQFDTLVFTDADCTFGRDWLNGYLQIFQDDDIKLAFGLVTFTEKLKRLGFYGWFDQAQSIEFASLVGAGAASWQLRIPNMCNGANIAYRKSVFNEVAGFEGNMNLNSGDDEFLMHKVVKKYPRGVQFIKSKELLVATSPNETLHQFYRQRIRWASKWENYTHLSSIVSALYIWVINLFTFVILIAISISPLVEFFDTKTNIILLAILISRWLFEYVFLKDVMNFMDKKLDLYAYLMLIIVYPFYVVYFGLVARFNKSQI